MNVKTRVTIWAVLGWFAVAAGLGSCVLALWLGWSSHQRYANHRGEGHLIDWMGCLGIASFALGLLVVVGKILATYVSPLRGVPNTSARRAGDQLFGRDPAAGLGLGAMALTGLAVVLFFSTFAFVSSGHSPRNDCIQNLRQLDGAKQQWALEHRMPPDALPTAADVAPYLKHELACPLKGVYTLNAVSNDPTCSIPGHVLSNP